MARIETDPNYSSPTFSRATAGTDLFKKEDVQALAAAVSTHDHTAGKGAVLVAGSIPAGSITSGMIADATIDTADLKDGAVTSAKIADGTIATADHADASVTNAKLASDTARANLLTNGGFEIWQRGNGPFAAASLYFADRWQIAGGLGTSTVSISRDTANVDVGSGACAVITFVKGDTNPPLFSMNHEVSSLRGQTLSGSIRVRTSTANAVRAYARVNAGTATLSAAHSGGGTYETLTVTFPVTTGAVTEIRLGVQMEASCTAYIDNAMLVVGSVPADYAPLHPADDLARCQRYYETLEFPQYHALGLVQGNGTTATTHITLPIVEKAVTPTVTASGGWNIQLGNGASSGVTFVATANKKVVAIGGTAGAGITNGTVYQFYGTAAPSAVLLEGNP